jgi:hypothetical protein
MTPSSLAAAARRLGGTRLYRHRKAPHDWNLDVSDGDDSYTIRRIGSDADLCMALLETMPAGRLSFDPDIPHWMCEADWGDSLHMRDAPTPLEAVLACVEAMEGT